MKAISYVPLIAAIFALSGCEKQGPPVQKIDGIECDAVCQARLKTSGTGDFPALDTKVTPRHNGAPAAPAKSQPKE